MSLNGLPTKDKKSKEIKRRKIFFKKGKEI
jgi:hypothetical protein